MSSQTRQYDGDLAVAALGLNILLTATQIGFVADGMMIAGRQGWFVSLLFALVIATGLLHSQFVLKRLWQRGLPTRYAWCFAALTGAITLVMAVWSMTRLAEPWTLRWYLGAYLGVMVPLQTTLLANMAGGVFELAGKDWFEGSLTEKLVSVVLPDWNLVCPEKPAKPTTQLEHALGVSQEASVAPSPVDRSVPAEKALAELADEVEIQPSDLAAAPLAVPVFLPSCEQQPAAEFVSTTRKATISFNGEQVSLRVSSAMPKRKWKEMHSEIRRIASIEWGDARKAVDRGGVRERSLSGTVIFPERHGRKGGNQQHARQKHRQELLELLKRVVDRYA